MQIALSIGEPAGIGPNLAVIKAQHKHPNFIVFADANVLKARANLLNLQLKITDKPTTNRGELFVHHIPCKQKVEAGKLMVENSGYVLECLDLATQYCLENNTKMLTLPVHKGIINEAGFKFSGHTEYLANITNTKKVVMLLSCNKLNVALATTHLPLKDVSNNISKASLTKIIQIIHNYYPNKKIIPLGLNPHAGENGFLGDEEITTINPVVKLMQQKGINIDNTIPADTAFSTKNMQDKPIFLAMYHDQGLSVLKTLCFNNAVNITLGLPFVRVSVDHGTAINLAHTKDIHLGSFDYAIKKITNMA